MNKWGTREWFENMCNAEYADSIGDKWGTRWRGSQKFIYDSRIKILKKLLPKKKMKILDIGCALGDFTKRVWQLNPENEIFVLDTSKNAINYVSKKYANMRSTVGALPNLPFKGNFFDLVMCLEVLYYLSPDDRIDSLENIKKTLKTDGYLFFSGVLDGGIRYFSEGEIVALISKYFEVERIEYNYAWIYTKIESKFLSLLNICDTIEMMLNMSDEDFFKWCDEIKDKQKVKKIKQFIKIMNKLPFGHRLTQITVRFISKIIRTILSLKIFVILSCHISKLILKDKGKTKISIWGKNSKKVSICDYK